MTRGLRLLLPLVTLAAPCVGLANPPPIRPVPPPHDHVARPADCKLLPICKIAEPVSDRNSAKPPPHSDPATDDDPGMGPVDTKKVAGPQ